MLPAAITIPPQARHGRREGCPLAADAFDWKTSCVDERINVLDVDTTAGTATDGRNPRLRYCGLVVHHHLVGPLDDRGAHANGTDTAQLWFRIVGSKDHGCNVGARRNLAQIN